MRTVYGMVFFLYLLMCTSAVNAQFNPKFDFEYGSIPTDALRAARTDAVTLKELRQSKNYIERDSECRTFFDLAGSSKKDLIALNDRFAGKATPAYQKQFHSLKASNAKAQREYKACFVAILESNRGRYPNIHKQILLNHTSHRARMEQLDVDFEKISDSDLDLLITDLTARLRANLVQQAGNYAVVSESSGALEYQRNGVGPWLKASEGHTLGTEDTIRTRADSIARVSFKASQDSQTTFDLNMSPNTKVRISEMNSGKENETAGVINLLSGTIRAIKHRLNKVIPKYRSPIWYVGPHTWIVGIRGTEVAVHYSPDTGIADYHLDHGDAFITIEGKQVTLQPQTSVSVQDGQIGEPKPLSKNLWNSLVAMTSAGNDHLSDSTPVPSNNNDPVYSAWTTKVTLVDILLGKTDPQKYPGMYVGLQGYERQAHVADMFMNALRTGYKDAYFGSLTPSVYAKESSPGGLAALDQLLEGWGKKNLHASASCVICDASKSQCTVLSRLRSGSHDVADSLVDMEKRSESDFHKVTAYQVADKAQKESFMKRNPACR